MFLKCYKKTLSILLFATFTIFSFCTPAFATNHFVITGDYQDSFQLESNNIHIFEIKDCVPGDSWESVIEIKNLTSKDMDIAVMSIESLIEDTTLYDSLNLTIMHKDQILYTGNYGDTPTPVTAFVSVKGNNSLLLSIFVSLPEDTGNVLQGKEMSSLWTFEAKHPGYYSDYVPDYDETTNESDEEPSNPTEPTPEIPEEDIVVPGTPIEPIEPPDDSVKQDSDKGIKTGVELANFNTSSIVLFILGALAICIGFIFILKTRKKG